jgi:tetratricopeptide (TPR) repeat protein
MVPMQSERKRSMNVEPNVYMLPTSDMGDERMRRFVHATRGKRATRKDVEALKKDPGWKDDPVLLKLVAIALQHLFQYRESERLLRRLFTIARHGADRCAALANLATGYFRQEQYEFAFIWAVRSMRFDPGAIGPWLIAAAAVGRLNDDEQLKRFCRAFGRAFKDLHQHPFVIWALLNDPDLSDFVCSAPFMDELEDRLLEAQESLEARGVSFTQLPLAVPDEGPVVTLDEDELLTRPRLGDCMWEAKLLPRRKKLEGTQRRVG